MQTLFYGKTHAAITFRIQRLKSKELSPRKVFYLTRPRLYIVHIQAVAVAQNLTNSGQKKPIFMANSLNIKDELSPNPSLIRP